MSGNDPHRWRRALELFDRVVDSSPAARAAVLDAECAGDAQLRAEVERLLALDAHDDLLDHGVAPLLDAVACKAIDRDETDRGGELLGAWRLQRLLGRGGMGEVYAARRDDDSGQLAAIKCLRRRWDGGEQALRFLRERKILAVLSHPNIPALLDHGIDGEARPWFALEFVDGAPLTQWVDAHRLDLRARIGLFRQVCAAVQHAHEHFVVHRDLKPANILVDNAGRARVLDFGVAKRLDESEGQTRTGVFAGFTPEYAAPEQISGGTISAATDVYALGVVLYQLLAGRLPHVFAGNDLRAATQAISTRNAPRLEHAITTGSAEEVRHRLQARCTDLRAFKRFVRGDLGRILQTALAKEPQRRYASVQRFSDDLARLLEGRTVSVSGDTLAYRMRKFVQRNRWGVAMAAVALLALLGGSGAALYRAHAERVQRERSEAILGFMQRLYTGDASEGGYGSKLTAMQLLDRASRRIDAVFPDDPIGEAQLLGTVAQAYVDVGAPQQGIGYLQRALQGLRPRREGDVRDYIGLVEELGTALTDSSRFADAVALVDREFAFVDGHDHVQSAELHRLRGYALLQQGDSAHAVQDLREAVAIYEAVHAPPSKRVGNAYSDLGLAVSDAGDAQQALSLFREMEAIERKAGDAEPIDLLVAQNNMAREYYRMGQPQQTIALLQPVLPQFEAMAGAGHARTVSARNLLSQAYASVGRYPDALAENARNLQALSQAADGDPGLLLLTRLTRAKLLTYAGRAAEALPLAQAGLADMRRQSPGPSVLRGRANWIVGETLLRLGRCAEAAPLLQAALDDDRKITGNAPSTNAGEAEDSLGRCRLLQGDAIGAQAWLQKAVNDFTAARGNDNASTLRSRAHLQWATTCLRDPPPQVLAALQALRPALVKALGGAAHPDVVQFDQLLQRLSAAPAVAVPAPTPFTGLNSLS